MLMYSEVHGFRNRRTAERLSRTMQLPPFYPQKAFVDSPSPRLNLRRTFVVRAKETISAAQFNGDNPPRLVPGHGLAWIMERGTTILDSLDGWPLDYFYISDTVAMLDEDGNPILDEDGNVIYQESTPQRVEQRIHNLQLHTYAENKFLLVTEDMDGDLWIVEEYERQQQPPGSIGPILGYGVLAANLCAETSVDVSGITFLDGTAAIPSTATVANPCLHRGKVGDFVFLLQVNLGQGMVWAIFDIKKQQQVRLSELKYVGQDTCKVIAVDQVTSAVETCGDPVETPKISTTPVTVPHTFEVPARTLEDSTPDQNPNGACKIVAHTKIICVLGAIAPPNGQDMDVATFQARTLLKSIFEDTKCVSNQIVPIVNGMVQTVYVLCSDTPVEDEQLEGKPCQGEEESC